MNKKTVIVTGGAGFIGCNFVRWMLQHTDYRIVVWDKLTYAGSLLNLEDVRTNPSFQFIQLDIADAVAIQKEWPKNGVEAVVNFAAETHVDRSIDAPSDFVQTNVVGTCLLLDAALNYFRDLSAKEKEKFRFLHVSTDEVYGTLGATGLFSEQTPYAPNSPYAASKAAADHFVRAYGETYGLPVLITNCSNNFGPYQFPEKLIPLMILNAWEGKPLPIYGDGGNVRDWLYVDDHCEGIRLVLEKGKPGEKYNIGASTEKNNLMIVEHLCQLLETILPAAENPKMKASGKKSYADLKTFVKDRPGHDRRYAIDSNKIQRDLGWKPAYRFEDALKKTVQWYLKNLSWCENVQSSNYSRERLGLGKSGT